MKKHRIGMLLAVLLMFVLVQEESADAQQRSSRRLVWSKTFDTPESIGRIKKVGGSPSTDNVLEIVNEGMEPDNKSFKISFTAGRGDSWYIQLLVKERIDPDQLLKIAGAIKCSCEAEVKVYFSLGYTAYSDANYTKSLGLRRSRVTKGISERDVWESILDEPFNLKERSLEVGLSDPYQELVFLELKVLNLLVGERISIWVDDLSIKHPDQDDIRAYEESIQVAYDPDPYKSQTDNFYYGYFGGVHGCGFPKYHTQHNLIPVDKRALVNIEFMINGNFNHVVGGVVFPEGENVDLLTRNIALLTDYGVYTTPIVPINPFYNRSGPKREATTYQVAERLLRKIVPIYGPVLLGTYWEHERKLPITCKQLTFATPFDRAAIGTSYNRGKNYDVVVVYNRDSLGRQSGTVDLSAVVEGRRVYDLYDGQEVALSHGALSTGILAEGDGKIYLIADDSAARKVADEITHRKYKLLQRKFDFYYREQRHNKMDMAGLTRVFEKNEADVKSDPGKALAELKSAFTRLKAREQGTTPFARSHALLKKAQASYVEIVERQAHYWSHVVVDEDPNELVRAPGYMDWERETRQLSDVYILLRNVFYFGRAQEVLPLAEQLAPKVAAMVQAVKRDQYQPVNARAVYLLHKKVIALNDFDLIKALRGNMK